MIADNYMKIVEDFVIELKSNDKILKEYANWTYTEIFVPQKIKSYFNIIIRHSGRIICERAYLGNHITKREINKVRPPYHFQFSLFPI